jgi:hypothetical protein
LLATVNNSFPPASEREARMDDPTRRCENDTGNETRLSGPPIPSGGPFSFNGVHFPALHHSSLPSTCTSITLPSIKPNVSRKFLCPISSRWLLPWYWPAPSSCESGRMIKPLCPATRQRWSLIVSRAFISLFNGYSSGFISASGLTMYSSGMLTFNVPRTSLASPVRASISPITGSKLRAATLYPPVTVPVKTFIASGSDEGVPRHEPRARTERQERLFRRSS